MNTNAIRATLLGATGLIGNHLLDLLLSDNDFQKVKVITRRPVQIEHPKLEAITISFDDKEAFENAMADSEFIFCAIGTTMKKVKGDKDLYRKIDYDIPVNAANIADVSNAKYFGLVSSVGADSKSKNFYLNLKGQIEEAILSKNISSINIFRPSMLIGQRKEFRILEKISEILLKPFTFLMPKKYRPIEAKDVAKAMLVSAKLKDEHHRVLHYQEIIQLAAKYNQTSEIDQ